MPEETQQVVEFVSYKSFSVVTGTWTETHGTGLSYLLKTATDETSTVHIPLPVSRRSDQFGAKLKKTELIYRCITADLDAAPGSKIYRQEFDLVVAGATGDIVAAELTTTNDGVVTADANDRRLTTTVTTPIWDYDTEVSCAYKQELTFNCAATTVIRLYGLLVYFDFLV